MLRSRQYHSTAILLPDARVIIGGEGQLGHEGKCIQIFRPPYLYNANDTHIDVSGERPVIASTGATSEILYLTSFFVQLDASAGPDDVSENWRVSFIRLGAAPHSYDHNQRFLWLDLTPDAANQRLIVAAPSQANVAPPGHYMLFVLRPDAARPGMYFPSKSRIIRLNSAYSSGG